MSLIRITKFCSLLAGLLFILPLQVKSQSFKDGKLFIDDTGNHYLKLSFVSQFWLRTGQYNPGTTVFGYTKESGTDIGIRRCRTILSGQLTDRVFFFTQVGINNFNSITDRKLSFFVHDAFADYAIDKSKLSLGMGLSGWSGLSRFASPSVGTIMGLDAPLYQQTTNDVTDQFVRKLSVYAKGKLGKFDYRIAMAQPLAFQKSPSYSAGVTTVSNFSGKPANMQWNGYVQYQLRDQESNQNPYMAGTYHGKKNVLNIGAGIVYQKDAMWHLSRTDADTVMTNLLQYNLDLFYDAPLGTDGRAISVYAAATHLDYGPGYIRNLGPNNPANGNNDNNVINGAGLAFPDYGTGNVFYVQAGYKFKNNLIGSSTLMPYASVQFIDYTALAKAAQYYSFGVNYLISGNNAKITLAYENRPVFYRNTNEVNHKGSGILQYQISF